MSVIKKWRRRREELAVVRELQKLSDKELKDIGINRNMIEKAVKKNYKKATQE